MNQITPGLDGPGENRHALQDYQMQLMLLEQQNKKRLMQANREGNTMGSAGTPGAGGFGAPNMSPSGSRGAGPSPNPGDQMKRMAAGTPKLQQQAIPGSPMPDMQNRASPNPGFDPNTPQMTAPGMPQQYFTNMNQNSMARPPSSHPNFTMNMGAVNQQSLDQMQRMANTARMPNGQPWPQGMSSAMQANAQSSTMRNAQPGAGAMGPPPAPAGEQPPSQRTQPSSPAQPPAQPTPPQANKSANKQKKETAAQKKVKTTHIASIIAYANRIQRKMHQKRVQRLELLLPRTLQNQLFQPRPLQSLQCTMPPLSVKPERFNIQQLRTRSQLLLQHPRHLWKQILLRLADLVVSVMMYVNLLIFFRAHKANRLFSQMAVIVLNSLELTPMMSLRTSILTLSSIQTT
jgi:hypothetical protein